MASDMRELFEAEAPSVPVPTQDLSSVINDGRKRLRRRRAASFSSAVVVLGVIAGGVAQIAGEERLPVGPRPNPSASVHEMVFEEISERDRAEIFAFRALADAGLMDPFGKRSFLLSDQDDTTPTNGGGWRVGLAASDCEPSENRFTCTGLSGEDPERGHALADTSITVVLEHGEWRVVDVEGNMLATERAKVIGHTLRDREEPTHWEFPAVGAWPSTDGTTVEMFGLWVGPNPTSAPGSICVLETFNEQGDPVGDPDAFHQEPPPKWFDTAGIARSFVVEPEEGIAEATAVCHQFTGRGWEITSGPQLEPDKVSGLRATLTWYGDKGVTTDAVCRATLIDENGDEVWAGSGKLDALWRPGELKDYPYRADIHISTAGRQVDADSIGEFTCESR